MKFIATHPIKAYRDTKTRHSSAIVESFPTWAICLEFQFVRWVPSPVPKYDSRLPRRGSSFSDPMQIKASKQPRRPRVQIQPARIHGLLLNSLQERFVKNVSILKFFDFLQPFLQKNMDFYTTTGITHGSFFSHLHLRRRSVARWKLSAHRFNTRMRE